MDSSRVIVLLLFSLLNPQTDSFFGMVLPYSPNIPTFYEPFFLCLACLILFGGCVVYVCAHAPLFEREFVWHYLLTSLPSSTSSGLSRVYRCLHSFRMWIFVTTSTLLLSSSSLMNVYHHHQQWMSWVMTDAWREQSRSKFESGDVWCCHHQISQNPANFQIVAQKFANFQIFKFSNFPQLYVRHPTRPHLTILTNDGNSTHTFMTYQCRWQTWTLVTLLFLLLFLVVVSAVFSVVCLVFLVWLKFPQQ